MVSILEPLREPHRTHSSTKQPSDSGTTTTTYADRLESYYVMLAGSSKMPLWGEYKKHLGHYLRLDLDGKVLSIVFT